jgi:hypothetical protein
LFSNFSAMPELEPYHALATALRERLAVIADREAYQRDAAAHLERLKNASARIEESRLRLPSPIDPQLGHFLERSSYDKALAQVETLLARTSSAS